MAKLSLKPQELPRRRILHEIVREGKVLFSDNNSSGKLVWDTALKGGKSSKKSKSRRENWLKRFKSLLNVQG